MVLVTHNYSWLCIPKISTKGHMILFMKIWCHVSFFFFKIMSVGYGSCVLIFKAVPRAGPWGCVLLIIIVRSVCKDDPLKMY